jgi:hypothetical protein
MKRKIAGIPVLLAAIVALSGCQAFFTTSLASGLKRTSVTVPADISNEDAAAILAGDPSDEMLASLLETLNDQAAAGDTGSATLAAEAAISVSGVSETIMDTVADVIATETPPSNLADFVAALETGYDEAGVATALQALSDPEVAAGLEPTQLLVAAVLLAASQLDAYSIDPENPDANATNLTSYQADANVALALDLVDQAATAIAASGGDPSLAEMLAGLLPMEATP